MKSCGFRLGLSALVQAAVVNLFVLNLVCFISVRPCILPETGRLENTYSLYVRVLQSARFGYNMQTEMKQNKFITNKLTTAASQDQSQNHNKGDVFSNLPVSGIQGQTEMKHTKF